jgi:uncharacterized protein (DUF433 family)
VGARRYPASVADVLTDPTFTTPLYTLTEAARIVGVPANTLHHWARGYTYKGIDGEQHWSPALVTTARVGRGEAVPFVGLGEAYVLRAFTAAGVPMQRIRPALARLEAEFGPRAVLTSQRLKTDGAEVLWEYRDQDENGDVVDNLVVVRRSQPVFREVVEQYLKTITYRDGRIALIRLPPFRPEVVVDPHRNFGAPTLASRGIHVADIRDRIDAGEPLDQLADDYRISLSDVQDLAAA